MNISEKIKEMQGDLDNYHELEKNEEEVNSVPASLYM